ncbi:MAG TPA: 2OG-Fe(II) oxygenase [Gammaproteobacteria bacterium]|nr:2OG-Fe(II) oxygenase [Gammaproteobacteria bacterium]
MRHLISAPVLADADRIREQFVTARPFRHACIEDFLEPAWAEILLEEFPAFDPAKAVDEFGRIGRKAVRTDLREISDRYREFFDYISSPPFLQAMSAMTGIPDLRFDAQMYGGGTHENLEGQALDAHVDFNYDQARKLHRRINLLVYLNKEWHEEWGGAIQLHSDPRDWEHDEIRTFNSTFNRCVVFETNEHSWHGFRQIRLPADKRGLTRKCISIYLYTEERPRDEIVPVHGTFYVQRPLPERFQAGRTLDSTDCQELPQLFKERNGWIEYYQRLEADLLANNRATGEYLASLLAHNRVEMLLAHLPRLPYPRRFLRRLMSLAGRRSLAGPPLAGTVPPELDFKANHVLSDQDVGALCRALRDRDTLIRRYQQQELTLRGEEEALQKRVAAELADLRLPLSGGLRQMTGSVQGAYAGQWVSSRLSVALSAGKLPRAVRLQGRFPEHYPADARIEARLDGLPPVSTQPRPGGSFTLELPCRAQSFELEVVTRAATPFPAQETDRRDLAFMLQEIRAIT